MSGNKSAMTLADRQAWRDRMLEEYSDNEMFAALGFSLDGKKNFRVKATGDIVSFDRACGVQIAKLADREWWVVRFPNDTATRYSMSEVTEFLCRATGRAGFYVTADLAE
ncbi:hypothetical protein [Paraburkholderia nemoris]|uniref:hypothetical protein n=1 Tax=Paraburkholderia nemoris TaxID=2793076 RepID=UPI001B075424|nr:hypothetical protein [Paraburkholderia nemoris]CAE6724528.1 hypothetical protein LMG22931_01892 [Paraburkholderia nemoris]